MNSLPIIRLEIEGLKRQVAIALNEYNLKLDEQLKMALDEQLSPENVQKILDKAVEETLRETISEIVNQFFRYGSARTIITSAVNNKLADILKDKNEI